jgi:hypothetical protein
VNTPPRAVVQAVWLLWVSLVIGLVEIALSMNPFRAPAEHSPGTHMTVFGVFASIALLASVYVWVVHHVRKGRNWARMTVLVSVAIGVVESVFSRPEQQLLPFVLNLLEVLLDITALTLLFREPGAQWFNRSRS